MKKFILLMPLRAYLIPFFFLLLASSCSKDKDSPTVVDQATQTDHSKSKQLRQFLQVNLVANEACYGASRIDPTLINGWGIAFSPTGTPWVNSQGGHVSDVYDREGAQVLPPVHIPSPGGNEGGNPTGISFNSNAADFIIPSGNAAPPSAARFIFVGVDGILSAWNGTWGNHAYLKYNNSATSAYTGLTLASNAGNNYLYAANFRTRSIDVWDRNWNPVSMPFADWHIPSGYAPFNIQVVNGQLYVMYAKVGPDGRSQAGQGKGFVNIFTTSGQFVKRFASKDKLNAPWGVAMAPASFFDGDMVEDDNKGHGNNHHELTPQPAILVGNFGDGRINAYSLQGKFLGQIRKHGRPLEIDGLWAITFAPTTSTIDPDRLYFAAGPDLERDGLFGYIIKDSTRHQNGGHGQD
ncbi:MAG: TIGR03118 family protein [Chitinophagaceae bacterium]|nr:TIGR03118 family protein [Chitinophagaceae bacterium]